MELDGAKVVVENINVECEMPICTPVELRKRFPSSEKHIQVVHKGQTAIKDVMEGKDHRLIVVVGPCSVHDVQAAREYAMKLQELAEELSDTLLLVMRVYFEKPRTNVGWKGLLNDPDLNGTFQIQKGLEIGRNLMLDITGIGLPIAAEALDVLTPQYIQDLVSWTAIGARTTESPCHRQMASAFTSAVGFKNGTSGDLEVAVNAIRACRNPSSFLTCSVEGQVCVVKTKGNPHAHIVLRGGSDGPNYEAGHIQTCEEQLRSVGLPRNIVIDASHGNSRKDFRNQPAVLGNIADQIVSGNNSIVGVMIESNLSEGAQKLTDDPSQLKYGVSITDSCLGWEDTKQELRQLRTKLKDVLKSRLPARSDVHQ